jgi:hypothetical protein
VRGAVLALRAAAQATIDDMGLFMKHVKPALAEMTRYNE